jgi:sigma-B regulation protein RsbU (phosphoserine phosphatase)
MNTKVQLPVLEALERLREQELVEARAIQSAMLPGELLRIGKITVVHEIQPFAEVGGDFLDYFELPDGLVGIYLGDVSGKGLPAALYAALAVGTLRGVHKAGVPPEAVLTLLNKRLVLRGVLQRYTTVQYATFDPQTGKMSIASAGMPGPLHLSSQGCRELHLSGIPPGMFAESNYDTQSLALHPGDSVIFVSDGITDTPNPADEMFGIERLQAVCAEQYGRTPTEILSAIFGAVEEYSEGQPQQDDRTAAIFHYAE